MWYKEIKEIENKKKRIKDMVYRMRSSKQEFRGETGKSGREVVHEEAMMKKIPDPKKSMTLSTEEAQILNRIHKTKSASNISCRISEHQGK